MNNPNEVIENSPYANYFKSKSKEELVEISHIKRFLECFTGDPELRKIFSSKKVSLKQLAVNRGLNLENIESLRPVTIRRYGQEEGVPVCER